MKFVNCLIVLTFLFVTISTLRVDINRKKNKIKNRDLNAEIAKVKVIVKEAYASFIKDADAEAKSQKDVFTKAVETLAASNKVTITPVDKGINVKKLAPTQNEIDVNKSIDFPLSKAEILESYIKCAGGFVTVKEPIYAAVANGKNWVIDGHHRWSQVYFVNPNCAIAAKELKPTKNYTDPISVLKTSQLAIAANLHSIPQETVQGQNLLKINEVDLKKLITGHSNITNVIATLKKNGIKLSGKDIATADDAAQYFWNNVHEMQTGSQPATGAPERGLMPQFDKADASKLPALLANVESFA